MNHFQIVFVLFILVVLSILSSCKKDNLKIFANRVKGDWIVNIDETLKKNTLPLDSLQIDSFKNTQMLFSFDKSGNYSFKEFNRSKKLWDTKGKYRFSEGWTGFVGVRSKELISGIPNQIDFSNFKNVEGKCYFIILNLTQKEFEIADPIWNIILQLKRIEKSH